MLECCRHLAAVFALTVTGSYPLIDERVGKSLVKGHNETLKSPGLGFRDQVQRCSDTDPTSAKNKAQTTGGLPRCCRPGRTRGSSAGSPRLRQLGHHLQRAIGVGFQLQGNGSTGRRIGLVKEEAQSRGLLCRVPSSSSSRSCPPQPSRRTDAPPVAPQQWCPCRCPGAPGACFRSGSCSGQVREGSKALAAGAVGGFNVHLVSEPTGSPELTLLRLPKSEKDSS